MACDGSRGNEGDSWNVCSTAGRRIDSRPRTTDENKLIPKERLSELCHQPVQPVNKAKRSAFAHTRKDERERHWSNLGAFNIESGFIREFYCGLQGKEPEMALVQYSDAAILEAPE